MSSDERPGSASQGSIRPRDRRPGLYDVARVAGVSHQTVSRVINDHPHVRLETRERVMRAISELGYRRNTAARALVTARSGSLGVILAGPALFGPTSTLLSIEEAAREAGYLVNVVGLQNAGVDTLAYSLELLMERGVDGIVLIAARTEVVEAIGTVTLDVPLVVVAAGLNKRAGFLRLAIDQHLGARFAVRHLADLGHRRIAHLAGPPDWFDAGARVRGWRAEMRSRGLPVTSPYRGDWSAESGYHAGDLIARSSLPDAIFAANDQMALGLMRALSEHGVTVPDDLSVVGFDDIDGAAFFSPPLTTIRQDFRALGRGCLELLLGAMLGVDTARVPAIPPTLITRASTTAAKGA